MAGQKLKSRVEMIVVTIAVIAVAALVNYLSNRFFYRIDLTENRQYTVSDATRRILRGLDDIVTVKAFFSEDLPPEMRLTVNTVRDLLDEYRNIAGGRLRVTIEDPAGNPETMAAAQSLGVPEITLQTFKRDKAESMRGYMGIGIMYADRKEAIPVVQNLANLEYDLTQAIMKVRRASAPKIGVLKSQSADFVPPEIRARMNMDGETTESKFRPLFQIFGSDYNVIAVDVSEGKPVDPEIRTLIVPGGERWDERAKFEVDQYFMNGGNLVVLANGVNVIFGQMGPQGVPLNTGLMELLEHYGVRVERNLIMDASCGRVQMPRQVGMLTINELMPYPYFIRIFENGFAPDNPAVSAQSELMLAWASSLTPLPDAPGGNVAAQLLVSSSEQSWAVAEQFDLNPRTEYAVPPADMLKHHSMAYHLSGDFKSYFDGKPIPKVRGEEEEGEADEENKLSQISLGGDKDRAVSPSNSGANLVVIGDANFISANNATRPNVAFIMNLVDWLSLDDNLIAIRSRQLRDKTINANILEDGSSKPGVIRWINLLLMPVIVAIAGIVISLKRREKTVPPVTVGPSAPTAPSIVSSESSIPAAPTPSTDSSVSTEPTNPAASAGSTGNSGVDNGDDREGHVNNG